MLAELAKNIVGFLKLISGAEILTIDATDGEETVARAEDLFNRHFESNLMNRKLDVKSLPTKETNVAVYELIKDGTFEQIYNAFGDNLDMMCLTQPQIIGFVKKHRKWLRGDGYGTFFLFKKGDDFFVVHVSVVSASLVVSARRLLHDSVWFAKYRHHFVLPLAPLSA